MAYANYEDLMELTNQMLSTLVREHGFTPRTADNTDLDFTSQYQRLQFLPALENALDTKLPDPTQLEDSDSLRYAYRCFSWKGGGDNYFCIFLHESFAVVRLESGYLTSLPHFKSLLDVFKSESVSN